MLFDRAGAEAVLFVFEPDLLLLRTAFEHRDLSRLIESGRVHFFTQPDKADLLTRLTPHTALLSLGVATDRPPAEPAGRAGIPPPDAAVDRRIRTPTPAPA